MPISGSNMPSGTPPVVDSLILEVKALCAGYGEIQVLWGVDLSVRRGEITALIGSNGAGKTTLMRALSGLIPTRGGHYFSEGRDLTGDTAAEILVHGIVHVPEGRRLFGAMSVEDNLLMGAYSRKVGRGDFVRRRAADVRDRPWPDERAAAFDDRRIVARPVAAAGRAIGGGVAGV